MEETVPVSIASQTYTKQNIRDNTLDDAQLSIRCPLDNGRRHAPSSSFARYSVGRLECLPAELLIQVLLWNDIPSLTRFRLVNRHAMQLVDSVPQYAAIVKHCPDILRAILSIQAEAYDCHSLFTTLSTTRCSTCERFGDHLCLIDCRRVCYFCFTRRLEYFPLTVARASSIFLEVGTNHHSDPSRRQRLLAADLPSIVSLPGQYCTAWAQDDGNTVRERLQLYDRRAVIQDFTHSSMSKVDKTTREPLRYMAIISAPYLFSSGREADWGYFCLGCSEEQEEAGRHFRIKYTRDEVVEHIAKNGLMKSNPSRPGRFMHFKCIA